MKLLILVLLTFCFKAPLAYAQEAPLGYAAFKHIPILHDGRVKPMDTFARAYLHRLSGAQEVDGKTAIAWLAESLFRPDLAVKKPFIVIEDARLVTSLGLPEGKEKRYTYNEIADAYEQQRDTVIALIRKGEKNLSKHEKTFLDFYSTINDYSHITRALTLVLPSRQVIDDSYANTLGLSGNETTYLELIKAKERVIVDTQAAVKRHGNQLEKYSKMQQAAAQLAFYFVNMEATGKQNSLFRIIPAFLTNRSEWVAPWAMVNGNHGSPKGSALLEHWKQLAQAYHQNDADAWQEQSQIIRAQTAQARNTSDMQLDLEVYYHQLNPTLWIMLCYGLAFVLLLGATLSTRLPKVPACYLLGLGVVIHTAMIVVRMVVLERPPVGTLYESVVFVALIAVLLAWRLDRNTTLGEGKLIGSLLGAFLVGVSGLFAAQGDTLGVLVAVLNTNFWLATHVTCITIGYGCAMVAGTMAHVYLMTLSDGVGKKLQTTALIALLFTAIGTILGGIWADQSWGRFWGWDPKENGALAIVLWLIWVLHGRITGHLGVIGFAACLCVTNIIVALSWFGVNLLSVGLHSYGFTDAAAYGLTAFCGGELVLIAGLTYHAKRRVRHAG